MPIPSRVEVLSWNENKVADLVREQKLPDCVDCIFQRHIDGQKLLNLEEGDVLHFLEIHNENSRRKLWNIFKKITEKKGGVQNLMSKFQQPNGRSDSVSDELDGEESSDDSFDSESDSDIYDLPEEHEPPNQQERLSQISVERKNTIEENLLAAMVNSGKPPAVVSPDPRDFDSSGYSESEDIYDTPEDGCDEQDDEMYEAPTCESSGGVIGHHSLNRQESEQYIVPNGNHGKSEDEEEYEVPGARVSDPEESPEEYVVPDGVGVPPRPPKPSEKPTPQKSPHMRSSRKLPAQIPAPHKPPAQSPAPYNPPPQKPSTYKPPAKIPPPHTSPVHRPPTPPKPVPTPPTPDPTVENYEAPEPPPKKVPNTKKSVLGGFKLAQPKNAKNTRVVEPELEQENYEAPAPPEKSTSKPVVQEQFEEEQEDYAIPSCTEKDIEAEPQEDYEIPSQEQPKPKPMQKLMNFPKMFGKTNRSGTQSAPKLTSRISNAINKPDTSHNAQQAPPVPSTLPPIIPGPQKPAHAGSSNGPRNLPSRGSRAPMPGESKTKSDSPPTPLKPPAQRPLPCPEGLSPSTARSNGCLKALEMNANMKRRERIHSEVSRTTSHRAPMKAGLPSKPLPKTKDQLLLEQPWFHGTVKKEFVSETLKKANRDGAYIVRNSSRNPGQYTMSLFYKSDIRHLEIPFENGQYRLGKSGIVKFDSIIDLHEYYKKNDIEFSAGGRTRLAYPCTKKA